ncbi:hypothetical protein [Francisella philomiragia]|uniref:hypothetical protein n=1 Tax=Francisella philomiragia TaxID=28110 RepID=UPI002242EB60|nr:hypothetical protein [Francisella philomiragia]
MLPSNENLKEGYKIALPCEPTEFSEFIGKLLGKPQTITKTIKGCFDVTKEDIKSTYHLVTQRVNQQNRSNLLQFRIKLVFNDSSTVMLNSFDDFCTYAEVRPLIVVQAHLSWIFLVQYQDKEAPEKQEIDLSFIVSSKGMISIIDSDDFSLPVFSSSSAVFFRIRHTARTWGADIEALLTGHIQNLLKNESTVKKIIRKHCTKVGFMFGFILFISSLVTCFYSANKARISQLDYIKDYIGNNISTNQKVDFLLQLNANGFWGIYFFYVFIFIIMTFILSIFLTVWVTESASARRPSHILLTKKSEENKVTSNKKYERKWLSFVISLLVSIFASVLANVLFSILW